MASHGSTDNANNTPLWALNQLKKTPNSSNRTALFGNTTADAFISGTTKAVVGMDATETTVQRSTVAHAGIVLRTVGSGGRAGRVMTEVLVASGSFGSGSDASDDALLPDMYITITTNPTTKSVNTDTATTFNMVSATTPSGGSMTYQWQANTGAGFADLSNAGVYSNVTTATLSISNTAGLNGVGYRGIVLVSGAQTTFTAPAILTVV